MGGLILGALLMMAGVGLMFQHWATKRRQRAGEPLEEVASFQQRQFRRRMLASGLMILLGLFCAGGIYIDDAYFQLGYWSVAAAVVFCLLALAAADIWSTRDHFSRLNSQFVAQRAELEEEVARLKRLESNEHNGNVNHGDESR